MIYRAQNLWAHWSYHLWKELFLDFASWFVIQFMTLDEILNQFFFFSIRINYKVLLKLMVLVGLKNSVVCCAFKGPITPDCFLSRGPFLDGEMSFSPLNWSLLSFANQWCFFSQNLSSTKGPCHPNPLGPNCRPHEDHNLIVLYGQLHLLFLNNN